MPKTKSAKNVRPNFANCLSRKQNKKFPNEKINPNFFMEQEVPSLNVKSSSITTNYMGQLVVRYNRDM